MNIIKLLRNYFLLLNSDFFDSKYYLKENPDVAKAKVNPILHYLQFGWKEGRNPSPLFNTNDYIAFRPDIVQADICPLVHYELFGKREFLSFYFAKIKYLEKKIFDLDVKTNNLDTKFNKKTVDLDNKYEKKTTNLDTKMTNLDVKFNKKTDNLDTKYGKRIADLEKFKHRISFTYNSGINRDRISFEIEKYFESHELGITTEKREPELIVSLTSYPTRMYDIHYTIYSLLTQSLKPNKIILWLGEEQFPNRDKDLPKKILEFTKYGLTIKYTKDIKQFKKLLPSLKEYPNSIIVTTDDDVFYPQDWLKKLYNCWNSNRNCIICHCAHRIKIENGQFLPYDSFDKYIIEEKPSYCNFFIGNGGILYPPNSLYKDIENFEALGSEYKSDDIWFWAMAVMNGTKIKVVDEPFNHSIPTNPLRDIGLNNDGTLWLLHKSDKDIQLKKVIENYPKIMEKLLSE